MLKKLKIRRFIGNKGVRLICIHQNRTPNRSKKPLHTTKQQNRHSIRKRKNRKIKKMCTLRKQEVFPENLLTVHLKKDIKKVNQLQVMKLKRLNQKLRHASSRLNKLYQKSLNQLSRSLKKNIRKIILKYRKMRLIYFV